MACDEKNKLRLLQQHQALRTKCKAFSVRSSSNKCRELVVVTENALLVKLRTASHHIILIDDGNHTKSVEAFQLQE